MNMNDALGRIRYHATHLLELPRQLAAVPDRMVEHEMFKEVFILQPYLWLVRDLKPNTIAIDIGACRGETAVYLAMPKEVAMVYAYELVPNSYEVSKANIELSPFKDKIKIFNLAISSGEGTVYAPKDSGAAGSRMMENGIPIKSVGLNAVLEGKRNVIIKCDVEGAEVQIFDGKADLGNVYKIILEYHGKEAKESVTKVLEGQGFHTESVFLAVQKETGREMGFIHANRI